MTLGSNLNSRSYGQWLPAPMPSLPSAVHAQVSDDGWLVLSPQTFLLLSARHQDPYKSSLLEAVEPGTDAVPRRLGLRVQGRTEGTGVSHISPGTMNKSQGQWTFLPSPI